MALSSVTAAAGSSVNLSLSVSSPAGSEPAGLEWTLAYPTASVTTLSVVPGPSAAAAGKSISCNGQPGAYTCVLAGPDGSRIANGVVATVTATLGSTASTASIAVNAISAVDPTGNALVSTGAGGSITTASAPASISVRSISCTPSTLASNATSACTVTLSAPASAATAVTLSSNSAGLAVPASVTVAMNAASATFNATAGSITAAQTAVVTATLNGSSQTATVSLTPPTAVTLTALQCAPSTLASNTASSCTVTLSAPATASAAVTLSSNSAALTVPASVTVAANATSATFTAAAGSITAAQTASVTATLNGSSKTVSVSLTTPTVVSITALQCAPSTLSSNSTSSCTVTLSAPATAASAVTLSSNSTLLTVPGSVTVPMNAASASFTAATGLISVAQSATIAGNFGSSSMSAPISLTVASSGPALLISGVPTEAPATTNGSPVTPTVGPAGFAGKVVTNGTGAVTFASAGGVSFTNCCGNTNNAYYKFTGTGVGNLFSISQGQISFMLTSRYSFADRQAMAAAARYAFDVQDGNRTHQYQFYTQIVSGYLVFYYSVGGTSQYYYVPKGTEDTLFGKGVTLSVTMKWDGRTVALTLNGACVKTASYVPANVNWTTSSVLDFGASEYLVYGGYNSLDDTIAKFTLASATAVQTAPAQVQTAMATTTATPLLATDGAPAAGSLACSPKVIAPGSKAVCELRLRSAALGATTASLATRSQHLHVPAALNLRPGQAVARFEVTAAAEMPEGDTMVQATLGDTSVEETLVVSQPDAPTLRTPRTLRAVIGTPVRFDVVATGGAGEMLSVSALPAGAVFDAASGSFAWIPSAGDVGAHRIRFAASNSFGRSAAKVVDVTVEATAAESGPQILTVGDDDSDQALAVHAGTSTLATIPGARYDGQPARAGDLLSISVTGLDCSAAAIPNLLARFGRLVAPVLSVEPIQDAPGSCRVATRTPAGLEGPATTLRLDFVSAAGIRTGNTTTISVE